MVLGRKIGFGDRKIDFGDRKIDFGDRKIDFGDRKIDVRVTRLGLGKENQFQAEKISLSQCKFI